MDNNKIRIRPADIEIPECDPFKHDLLDRKRTIRTLTNLLQNLESPYTMSIDSSWGNGKTTFLNMWKQHLKDEEFPVIGFNAWETDFAGSPLVALTSELLKTLKCYDDQHNLGLETIETTLPRLHKTFLTKAIPGLISLVGGVVSIHTNDPSVALAGTTVASGLSIAMDEATKEEPENQAPEPISYSEAKEAICSFRNALRDVAETLSENYNDRPLIIAIDELDRCRPSYAVELLEIAKHLFSVENIVFVLAIDKSQLAHAIRALYGNDFDSIGYLRRFIDLDFRLPDPDRAKFMTQLMDETMLARFFGQDSGDSWGKPSDTQRLLRTFLSLPALSLRQIQQAMHRLGLVLSSLDSTTTISYGAIAVLVILKTIDPVTYQRFNQAEMTDKEVTDKLFGLPGLQHLESTNESALFKALLVMGYCEFTLAKGINPMVGTSSLFHHYCHIIDSLTDFPLTVITEKTVSPPLSPHEQQVLSHLRGHFHMLHAVRNNKPVGFNLTAQRMELFTNDLLQNDS